MTDLGTIALASSAVYEITGYQTVTGLSYSGELLQGSSSTFPVSDFALAGTQQMVFPTTTTITAGQIWPRSGGVIVPDEVTITATSPSDPGVDLWIDTSSDAPPPTASVVASTAAVTAPAGSTSVVTTIPAGGQAGDMLYLAMTCANTASGSPLTITATGWTALTALADQGTTQRAFYSAPWSGGLAGVTWTTGAAARFGFVCVLVRNGRTAVVSATDLGASGTVLTCPAVTATGTGLALRFAVRKDNLSTSVTGPGGSTTLQAVVGTTGPAPHVAAYSQVQAAAGTTGTDTITFNSAASANGTAWTVAV